MSQSSGLTVLLGDHKTRAEEKDGGCPAAMEAPEGILTRSWRLRKGFLDKVILKLRPLTESGKEDRDESSRQKNLNAKA